MRLVWKANCPDRTSPSRLTSQRGGGSLQTLLMHVTPPLAPQQSELALHLSPLAEHPEDIDWHMPLPGEAVPASRPPSTTAEPPSATPGAQ